MNDVMAKLGTREKQADESTCEERNKRRRRGREGKRSDDRNKEINISSRVKVCQRAYRPQLSVQQLCSDP